MCSFLQVVHEAPALLESLPLETFKTLSATCRSLRTSFCAHVKVITLSSSADCVSKLGCTTWPQLLMVVHFGRRTEVKGKLSPQWEHMMELTVMGHTAVLVQPRQLLHTPLVDLPSQHGAALSAFADKHRHHTEWMNLRGPFVGGWIAQALTLNAWPMLKHLELVDCSWLDADSMSCLRDQLRLRTLHVEDCFLDAAVLLVLSTEWCQLGTISLENSLLDDDAMSIIGQASWPKVRNLSLNRNFLCVARMRQVVSCSLPVLLR